MSHHVGLDVSLKEGSICVVDGDGEVLNRASVTTEPDTIVEYLAQNARQAERVVHESGILATWLTRELEARGIPITCITSATTRASTTSHPPTSTPDATKLFYSKGKGSNRKHSKRAACITASTPHHQTNNMSQSLS